MSEFDDLYKSMFEEKQETEEETEFDALHKSMFEKMRTSPVTREESEEIHAKPVGNSSEPTAQLPELPAQPVQQGGAGFAASVRTLPGRNTNPLNIPAAGTALQYALKQDKADIDAGAGYFSAVQAQADDLKKELEPIVQRMDDLKGMINRIRTINARSRGLSPNSSDLSYYEGELARLEEQYGSYDSVSAEMATASGYKDAATMYTNVQSLQNLPVEQMKAIGILSTEYDFGSFMVTDDVFEERDNARKLMKAAGYTDQQINTMAESLSRYRNMKQAQQREEETREEVNESSLSAYAANIMAIPANLVGTMTGNMALFGEAITRANGSSFETLDPNLEGYKYTDYASTVRDQTRQNIEEDGSLLSKAAGTVYGATTSTVDNLARIAVAGPAGSLALAGLGTFQETVRDVSRRGGTPAQAYGLGVINGSLEILTEKISLDRLLDLPTPSSLKQLLWQGAIQGGVELSEEELNFAAGIIFDGVIMGGKSRYNKTVLSLMNQNPNLSREEAEKQALYGLAQQAFGVALESFLSGNMMAGATGAQNYAQNKQLAGQFQKAEFSQEDVQAFISTGLESPKDSLSYKLADRLSRKQSAGQTITNEELAQLYQANIQQVQQERAQAAKNPPAQVAVTEDEGNIPQNGADVPQNEGNVPQNAGNVTLQREMVQDSQAAGNVQEDTDIPGLSLPTLEEDARDFIPAQNQNGGIQNVNNERIEGPGTAQGGGYTQQSGADLLYGSSQRYDSTGTGKQTGGLAAGTGPAAAGDWSAIDARRTQIQRNGLAKSLRQVEKVSSQSLGVQTGTDNASLQVIPEEYWDAGMRNKAEQIYQETGKQVTYVLGRIEVSNTKGGTSYAKGVITENGIIVQANNFRDTPEQISDHEGFHAQVDMHGRMLIDRLVERIKERFSQEEFQKVVDQYIYALRDVIDVAGARTGAEYENRIYQILEEVLADAHAGMNSWGAGATRYTDTVNQFLEENYITRRSAQDNGTPQITGPPAERYSQDLHISTSYEGRSLTEDPDVYSYDFLTSQSPMIPVELPAVSEVRDLQGIIDPAKIAAEGMKNALSVGSERDGRVYVRNRYTGRNIWVTISAIRHGLNGTSNRMLTNARLGSVIGDVIQNAIPINALHNTGNGVEGTYAMAAYTFDRQGREFVAIITVEQRTGTVSGIDAYDVTHAVSGRQNRDKQVDTKSQGFNPSMLASEINIADLLDAVKSTYMSILPENVLSRMDTTKSADGYYTGRVRYALDDSDYQQSQEQKEPEKKSPKKTPKPVAESKPLIAKKDLRSTMFNLFSVPGGQRAELSSMIDSYADRLIKNGSLTEEDRKNFFDRMYEAGVLTVPAEEIYAEGRNYVHKGKIYVPDSVIADFGDDWNDIRKRAFSAGVYLTRNRADAGIDVWNGELADMIPGLFDSEDTDQRYILERIVQLAEEGREEKVSLSEYTARLAQQEHISEDEFLDNMERQMDWALRTFAEKANLEIHLRDRTGKKIAQERESFAEVSQRQRAREIQRRADEREARKDATLRQRQRKELRELQQKTLKSLQWLNKNRNRAPEELKAAFDEVLSDIDIYAVGAANEMRWSEKYNATWQDLGQMYKDAMKNDPNFMPSKELERIVARLDGTKISEMDLGALNDLYRAAVGLRTEFYNRNNVMNDEENRLFSEVYTDAKKEIEAAPGGYSGKWLDKLFNLEQLHPMNVLQRMGGWDPNGAFNSMAKQLERGERDIRGYTISANKHLEQFLTDNQDWVKKADGQGKDAIWYEIEVPQLLELHMGDKPVFGPTVKVWMTPAQKVHMYLESKNLDNLRHMTGGRTFANKELYSKGKRQEAFAQGKTIRLAPESVKKIVSDLTPQEMELARVLERYYNEFATGEINRVSNILYGYDKAMGKNYAPIYTNTNYTKSEIGIYDATAEGVGNLKERTYAVNPSYNIGAFDAFERHVDKTARFVGMAIPARNWSTLLNWREKNNSTGDVITHKWGEEGKKYITDLLETLQGGSSSETDVLSSAANKAQSNYISAVFGANPSIVLKQLGSIPMASAYLGIGNRPKISQIASIDREMIAVYTPDLEWRTLGYSTPETKQLKENPNWTQTNKFFRFTFGGGAITAVDGWAASTLWPWAENKVRREQPGLEMGTEEQIRKGESPFYKAVAREFENAISRSQSVSDEIHQSRLRKSKNPVTRAFTLFRSDSAQTYNTIRQKIGEAQFYARTGAEGKIVHAAKTAAGAAFCAMLTNAIWSEAISFLMALWKNQGKYYRDDEDELTAESVAGEMVLNTLESLAGTVVGGEELFGVIGNILTGERWYDIEAPGMEQINDVLDTVMESGSGLKEFFVDAMDVVKNGGDLGEYFRKHSGEMLGSIKEVSKTACMYLTGLPAGNLEAYLLGAVKWASPELATAYEDAMQDVKKDDLSGLDRDALQYRVGSILEDRRVSESEDTARILAELYSAGYKTAMPSDTPSSITIKGDKKTLGAYQQQFYDSVWGNTVAGALDELVSSDAFVGADQKTQAKMLNNLYSYAAELAKAELYDEYELDNSVKKNAEIVAAGATVADCILWNSTTGEMKAYEKAAELLLWDIPEEAKRAVFRNKISESRMDAVEVMENSGLSFDNFLQAYSQYGKIDNMDLKASMKAARFSHWLDGQGYTAEQEAVIKDELTYFSFTPADAGRYDGFVESGMKPDDALELTEELGQLVPSEGRVSVSDVQKWRTCVDFSNNEAIQLSALRGVMDDSQFFKVELAYDFGVSADSYVTIQEIKVNYDADGSGTYKNSEIQAAIDSMGKSLTTEQKAVLWQLVTGSTSAKNNPYSREIGQKVLDAKAAAKNSDDDLEDSFSKEIEKQWQ